MTPDKITLGEHEYPLYAQRHAYLTNRLGKAINTITALETLDTETSIEGFVTQLGERAYDLLVVFYPHLMPKYEFMGYPTQEAMEAEEYNPDYDKSPTMPEITEAVTQALKVNRLDLLGHLGKVIRLDLIRAYLNQAMADLLESRMLPNSSSEDTSASMSSGMTAPTSTENEGSPSLASMIS